MYTLFANLAFLKHCNLATEQKPLEAKVNGEVNSGRFLHQKEKLITVVEPTKSATVKKLFEPKKNSTKEIAKKKTGAAIPRKNEIQKRLRSAP